MDVRPENHLPTTTPDVRVPAVPVPHAGAVDAGTAGAADERVRVETEHDGVRLFHERFAMASEQLGSDSATVRLAGACAMATLADDWGQGRQLCIDVLCGYLRMPYHRPSDIVADGSDPVTAEERANVDQRDLAARQEREVRQTVIRLAVAHLRLPETEPMSWSGHDFDFRGAVFDLGDFAGARFGKRVSFDQATFVGPVSFNHASFTGMGSFAGAEFGDRVSFDHADILGKMSFSRARFVGDRVSFDHTHFGGWASFLGAEFGADVSFDQASFRGKAVSFEQARFGGDTLSFDRAEFEGGRVYFHEAVFDGGSVSLTGARFAGGTLSLARANVVAPPVFDAWPDGNPPEGLILPRAGVSRELMERGAEPDHP